MPTNSPGYMREYYQKNKHKGYWKYTNQKYKLNFDTHQKASSKYRGTYSGHKKQIIGNWKDNRRNRRPLINENIDEIYDIYFNKTECDNCGIEFNTEIRETRKCLNKNDNGEFINIICMSCLWLKGYKKKV